MPWSLNDIPSQVGKLAIVTGASGGLGFEEAQALARHGAEVVVAARDVGKGGAAVARIGANARFQRLDLADLASVSAFASEFISVGRPIDLLVNNAGLAAPSRRLTTKDDFELQFGTNFLGHFALTGLLLPLLKHSGARVVTVSSIVERSAKMDFNDLMSEKSYSPAKSYGQSKLANLLFARELQRRSEANGWALSSIAAHPGMAITELTKPRPGQPVIWANAIVDFMLPFVGHDAAGGALPILYAAAATQAEPGGYYGPKGFMELKGPPAPAKSGHASKDEQAARQLWDIASQLTQVNF